jgi:ABC-type amino acid transport substrate-binding protein
MTKPLFHVLPGLLLLVFIVYPALAADVVRLAHDDPFPPFSVAKDGKSEGLVIDILQASLARVNTNVVFVPAHMDKIQDLMKTGEVDGLAFLGINPERQKLYDFSAPLVITGGALFVKSPSPSPSGLKEFEGRIVVSPLKGPLAGFIKKEFPKVNVMTVEDYPAALKAVLDGKADAAALNPQVGTHLANQLFPGSFTPPKSIFLEVPLAVAVTKGQQGALLKKVNEGLASIKNDGTYAKIVEKWESR